MSSFCFVLTEICNWNCNYCEYPGLENPQEITKEKIEKHVPYIKKIMDKIEVMYIDIGGGEIGTLDKSLIKMFLSSIDRKLVVTTNGLFLENNYHKDEVIRKYTKEIWWHYHPKPGRFKVSYDFFDEEIPIVRGIVHDNIEEIIDFLKINSDVEFGYVEFEFDNSLPRRPNLDEYEKLILELKSLKNVNQRAIDILESRFHEMPNNRDLCKKYNYTLIIDLAAEKIIYCHRNWKSWLPLSEENLLRRLSTFAKDIYKNSENCECCTRLYAGKFPAKEIILRQLMTKERLKKLT